MGSGRRSLVATRAITAIDLIVSRQKADFRKLIVMRTDEGVVNSLRQSSSQPEHELHCGGGWFRLAWLGLLVKVFHFLIGIFSAGEETGSSEKNDGQEELIRKGLKVV